MSKKRRTFKVRFKVNGKIRTFYTKARSSEEAAKRLRSKGTIIRSSKA